MQGQEIPVLPRGVRLHFDKVRDVWVLLAPERAVTLDMVGHAILQEVDGARTFDDIINSLATKYNASPEQIQKDSSGFLDALRNRRFLEVSS